MILVGREERPVLDYIVSWLAGHGVRDIVLLVGYRWRQVANYFGSGERWGARIRYSVDTPEYTGTGGALLNAWRRGMLDSDTVVVWYGDILATLDPQDLARRHSEWGADATLALAEGYQVPVGVAEVDGEGNVLSLREKPWLPVRVTIGVLALNPRVLGEAQEALGTSFDVMTHLIPWMIRRGKRVKAYTHRGPWYDVGSLERWAKLDERILEEMNAPRRAPRARGPA
jgi:mannose-1-phosphate guanylyltransferase